MLRREKQIIKIFLNPAEGKWDFINVAAVRLDSHMIPANRVLVYKFSSRTASQPPSKFIQVLLSCFVLQTGSIAPWSWHVLLPFCSGNPCLFKFKLV